jgi:hypothetical protein
VADLRLRLPAQWWIFRAEAREESKDVRVLSCNSKLVVHRNS